MTQWLSIIGIGEDGVAGLSAAARSELEAADVIIGGERHHRLSAAVTAERLSWPSPFEALIDEIKGRRGQRLVIVATGDPLWFSIGARIARSIPSDEIRYHPALSAFQWAACRMGWSLADVETLTAHGRPAEQIIPWFWPGARLLVLTAGAHTPGELARMLDARGYGGSEMTVFGSLGGPDESRHHATAAQWADDDPTASLPEFNTLAIHCVGTPRQPLARIPGLPDDAFRQDGNFTKREVRAITLAKLMPARDGILWDIGVGCGTVAIEWMRAARNAEAVGIDPRRDRLEIARENGVALGAPRLTLIEGSAPEALDLISSPARARHDLRMPDAVFIGGGLSEATFAACWQRLKPGGRLVANAVTLESEALLSALHARHGGELVRLSFQRAETIGKRSAWRPAMPVTQLSLIK